MNTAVSLFPCQQSSHSTSIIVCFCWDKMVLLLQPFSKSQQQPWSPITKLKIPICCLLSKVQCSNCTHLHCTVMFLQAVDSMYVTRKRIPSNMYITLKYKKVLNPTKQWFPIFCYNKIHCQQHFEACCSRPLLSRKRRKMTSDIQHILQMYSFYNCIPCCIKHSFTINTTVLLQSHYSQKAFLQISFKHNHVKNVSD